MRASALGFGVAAWLASVCVLGVAAARTEPSRLLADPAASLRAARAALAAGEQESGLALLAEVSDRHPIVGDYADLLRARVLLDEDRAAEVDLLAAATLGRYRNTPLRSEFFKLIAEARVAGEDEVGARAAWTSAMAAATSDSGKPPILLAVAESQERSGDLAAAADTYADLWSDYPTSAEAAIADERLARLEGSLERPVRTPARWRERADNLFRDRDNEGALEAYERALEGGLSASLARKVRYQRAHTLFRMRSYPAAVEAFTALPQRHDIPLWRARSLARAGDVPTAVAEFEEFAQRDRGELGMRALYLAGLLLDGRGKVEASRRHFESVARSRATPSLGDAALWRLGWAAYREQRYEDALRYLDRLLAVGKESTGDLRILYWRARALEHLGREEGEQGLAAIADEFPLSYYGWRSRQRLGAAAAPLAPRPAIEPGSRALAPHELARPRILLQAGMTEEGLQEMERVRRRARGLDDRLQLAQLFAEAGEYHRAQRVITDAYNESLARGPVAGLEELWWHAWPAAFGALVDRATSAPDSVSRELVMSIMREESGYRVRVVSAVGARGLLQIMGETGRQLAQEVGHPDFSVDDLFDAETNIRLGSHYLGVLSRRFPGQLSASIASYNAGPDAVSEWLEDRSPEDDEWVEGIPYDQTRSYVKRVMRSLQVYRLLY